MNRLSTEGEREKVARSEAEEFISDLEEILRGELTERVSIINRLTERIANCMGCVPNTGYTAMELLLRACRFPKGWKEGHVRWDAVGDVFKVGSTTAIALCRAVQIDPHEVKAMASNNPPAEEEK